ncbi:MAG: TIR domain-containing protein [Novosphingobium sp.]|nr:TIR domain-containing protein [Novosphingobium sp.]
MADQEPVRLFVSHHSSKFSVAQQVETLLAKRGIRCWIAPRDVPPGAPFDTAVHEAIEKSAAVLLLFCANSDKSRHVKRELILSDSAGRPIIPLRLEAIDPGDLAYHLADSQWVDWIDRRETVMDRVAAQSRLYANAPADLAADVTMLGAEPARSPGGGQNRIWLFAAIAGAALAALAIILFFANRGDDDQTIENATVATADGSPGDAVAADVAVTEAQGLDDGKSDNKALPPTMSQPAPAVVVAQPSQSSPKPVVSSQSPASIPTTEGPLQRLVQACRGAQTDAEYLICSDAALGQRAREMSKIIRQIRARYEVLKKARVFSMPVSAGGSMGSRRVVIRPTAWNPGNRNE